MAAAVLSSAAIVARLRSAGCVFAEDEARLLVAAAATESALAELVEQRVAGSPLEHVLGWAEFCGLRISVDPGVFVPRRRTELLVERATALARTAGVRIPVVVDLCCGSGAVGAALVAVLDHIDLYAVDIDPAAARCARRNIGADGRVYAGDLYEPLPGSLRGRVDILVANAPYVPTESIALMPPEARLYEPPVALDGGADGLDILRRVIATAPAWLASDGHLLAETSETQAPALVDAVVTAGLTAEVVSIDEPTATVLISSRR